MKHLLILLLLCPFAWTVAAQNQALTKITFTTLSRGYTQEVVVTPDSINIHIEDRINNTTSDTQRLLKKKSWQTLLNELDINDLSQISNLPSPTNKRTYDGARHSRLAFQTSDEIYDHLFDDENPHRQLSALLNCLVRMVAEN